LKKDSAEVAVQPQSGYILQPKVAVAATLGRLFTSVVNPERVAAGGASQRDHNRNVALDDEPRCG